MSNNFTPQKRPRRTDKGLKRLRGSYPQLYIEEQPADRRRRQDVYEQAVDESDSPDTRGIIQQAVDAVYPNNAWIGGERSDGRDEGNTSGFATALSANDQVAKEHDHCLVGAAAAGSSVEGRYCDEDAADQFYEEGGYSAWLAMEAVALSERLGYDYHNLEGKDMPKSTRTGKSRFNNDANLIGSEGTRVGAFNQKRLRVAVGPRVYNNNMSAFTEILNRTQVVHNEFALSYKAHENMRCWNMLHFRHMRHDNTHDDSVYRALANVNVLSPKSTHNNITGIKTPYVELITTPSDASDVNESGFKGDFYSPTSLVDLENLSWNLQGLTRLLPRQMWAASGSAVAGTSAQELQLSYKDADHFAGRSHIYKANADVGYGPEGEEPTDRGVYERPVENRAHIVGGSLNMVFTNVTGQPAVITLVLYKGKKTAASIQDFGETAGTSTDDAVASAEDVTTSAVGGGGTYVPPPVIEEVPPVFGPAPAPAPAPVNPSPLVTPLIATDGIGQRLYRACAAGAEDRIAKAIALKDFQGEGFTPNDVSVNPRKKFLPKSTVAGDTNKSNPVSEQYRVSYVLAGGATRAVKLEFPGQLYDPTSAMFGQDLSIRSGSGFKNKTSQINGQLYSVAVGVSGVRGLQQWTNKDTEPKHGIYGQGYGPANVQMKARYSETVGAMRVVVPKAPVGFGFNELQDAQPTLGGDPEVDQADLKIVTVLPQSSIVRTDDKPIDDKMNMDAS